LALLADDGRINKRLGAGSVVLERSETDPRLSADLTDLMTQIGEMGRATTARLLSIVYEPVPPRVASALNLAPDAKVPTAVRVRSFGQ